MSSEAELQRIPIVVLGVGGVGAALIRQLVEGRERTASRARCRFDVAALVDRKGALTSLAGLTDEQLLEALVAKAKGDPIDSRQHAGAGGVASPLDARPLIDAVAKARREAGILVDVTAAGGLEPLLDHALDCGWSIALANKKALAGPWATARRYFDEPRVRHESTVGGGQPVIATLRYLVDTNDPIRRIEGQLSGTMGFLCAGLDCGMTFSQALAEAAARGYTEPDPRDDLGGRDVARKLLILGRMAGWPIEADDVEVESLVSPELAGGTVAEFLAAAPSLDAAIAKRVAAERAAGRVLRYVASVEEGRGRVGLEPIPAGSPLANLKYVSFCTARYDDEPLLIGGKGAGVEMTAAGVVGDLIGLAREIHRAGDDAASSLT